MTKIISIIVIVIVAVSILSGLSKQIISALNTSKRLDEEANQVAKLTEKNQTLKKQLTEAKSPDSIEKIAREELNLAKPGETVMVIPSQAIDKVLADKKPQPEFNPPNWQRWFQLFIH